MDKIEILKDMIAESNDIVVLTGAGISTESGIPDFRSSDGLYNKITDLPPEYLLSEECFRNNKKMFYDYYKANFNLFDYEPNIGHTFLKELEDQGKLKAIITQNIDGLHTKAGCKNVYEIHGTINTYTCPSCSKKYDHEYVFKDDEIPVCECGSIIKPDVVLYGGEIPDFFEDAVKAVMDADMLLVIGTSLTVNPAASLVRYFYGENSAIINRDETPYDKSVRLVIHDSIKNVVNKIKE